MQKEVIIITNFDAKKFKNYLMQSSYECLTFSEKAVKYFSESKKLDIPFQLITQAFQCIKFAQYFYTENCEQGELEYFDSFYHQFLTFYGEFLESIQNEDSLQWPFIEFDRLQSAYDEMKASFSN